MQVFKLVSTPLYPTFEKGIGDAVLQLLRTQIDPWAFLTAGPVMKVTAFDGRTIAYSGVGFEGSPRQIFWSRYIEPFLEDLAVKQIANASREARERGVDGERLLSEVESLLLAGCRKVFERMAQIDQRLLGKGYPQRVPLRSTKREYGLMCEFVAKHTAAEVEMWRLAQPRQKPWHEGWYERNKFWVWLIPIVIALVTLATKFL